MYSSDLHGKSERLLKAFEEKVTLRAGAYQQLQRALFFFFLAFNLTLLCFCMYHIALDEKPLLLCTLSSGGWMDGWMGACVRSWRARMGSLDGDVRMSNDDDVR